ncbi:interferon regulatory factor 1 isoform X2 [Rhinatrema bivittatum]|uniref:interferon regulatory factor 1 isoform X2 n=1 Tax=Rhinatrema bivittatum TaxID=194408 RepID=UPI00112E15AA|nr:interferon regulatory factor 1 isoform X2 [Rhinatrema bivittatum]
MPVTRLRMRPWLEQKINSSSVPGLEWINKEKMIFQIPWKHAARHGWDMELDASLFRSWAIHTGRYKAGEKQPDPKTWKANFRCAMNSLPDIEEVKDKSINKGSGAVRVYRMLPGTPKLERRERKSKSLKEPKSKSKRQSTEDSLGLDETMDVGYSPYGPSDHSSYTLQSCSIQDLEVGSTDASLGFAECRASTEALQATQWQESSDILSADSTNELYSFQVSPLPSSSEETEAESEKSLAEDLAKYLEQPSEWQQTCIDGKGFFSNEVGTLNCFYEASTPDEDTEMEKTVARSNSDSAQI